MNLINDKINIKEMYKYQIEELDSDNYKEYLKYLDFFFLKEHKKEKYTKEIMNSKYVLIDKQNPTKHISITPSEFINIHKLYIDLNKYSEVLLNKISLLIQSKNNITEENRKEFENLKLKYISSQAKLKDIEIINKEFYDEMQILLKQKIEKTNELSKYYQKRSEEYSKIKNMIHENIKNKLIVIFKEKNKKIPSMPEINKIAKENNIPSIEIEKWFSWIESVYFYKIIKNDIDTLNNLIKEKENNYDMNTKYMIIKKPVVEK
jgi:hypothetical protein